MAQPIAEFELVGTDKLLSVVVNDSGAQLTFENSGVMVIKDYHEQDCCEHVWADMDTFDLYARQIIDKEYDKVIILPVQEMGFIVWLHHPYQNGEKVLVPCYNSQNGYYSSSLELQVAFNEAQHTFDISEVVYYDVD